MAKASSMMVTSLREEFRNFLQMQLVWSRVKMEKKRPKTGAPFKCPICMKRSIVGVTAKIVADHNHHTGDIRDFICDSCNTGLGRFKNGEDCLHNALLYLEQRETLNKPR